MENRFNLAGVNTVVIVRAIMTVLVAINVLFGYLGWHLIPLSDTEVGQFIDALIVLATAVIWAWGWWKNNSFTLNAQIADTILEELNGKEGDV